MEGELDAIAPDALETPASAPAATPEPVSPVDEPTRILDPGEEPDAGDVVDPAGATEPDTIEIEWDDGQKYTIPKALEGGLLKNKDYTQSKQKLADDRRALEAARVADEERSKATDEELDARADLRAVSKTLDEFSKLTQQDWDAHQAADPGATERAWRQYQMLKDQRTELEGKIGKAQAERTGKAEQGLATRIQETVEHAKKAIPGWKPDTIPKLVEFAQAMGVPEDAIKSNWSPTFIDLLHRAHLGDQLLKKQATAPKLPTPAPKTPLKTVNGNGSPAARGDLESADMESYVAMRKQGVGGKALR
jgi:hypothetical protein